VAEFPWEIDRELYDVFFELSTWCGRESELLLQEIKIPKKLIVSSPITKSSENKNVN